MRPFVLESVFWRSAAHVLLRLVGVSQKRPYRVIVAAEPLEWADLDTGERRIVGLFATRVVMAATDDAARDAAAAAVREAVLAIAVKANDRPIRFEIEESGVLRGIVRRQPRGFSLYEAE